MNHLDAWLDAPVCAAVAGLARRALDADDAAALPRTIAFVRLHAPWAIAREAAVGLSKIDKVSREVLEDALARIEAWGRMAPAESPGYGVVRGGLLRATAADAVARMEENLAPELRASALEAVRLLLAGAAAPVAAPPWPALDALFKRVRARAAIEPGDPAIAAFVREVEHEATRSESVRRIEAERKYRLRSLPDRAREIAPIEILQGYLPGTRIHERIRAANLDGESKYSRTIKLGRGIAKIEIEEETTKQMFRTMWPLTDAARIHKRRYVLHDGSFVWEIDEFLDRELILAEVELPHPDVRPPLPAWLEPHVLRDVTGDPAYLNVNLARAAAPVRDR